MCLNPVNEEFDRAYANVGLLASDVWSFHEDLADYKKANLNLWVRFNEVEQRLIEDESDDGQSTSTEEVRTVQDTIPFSRLASYNDFPYNEERERMYVSDDEPAQYIQNSIQTGLRDLEVWMLPEVEEEFKRLTHVSSSRWCSVSPRIPTGRELEPLKQLTSTSPYEWLTKTSWPDQLLSRYPDLPMALQDSRRLSLFKEDVASPSYDAAELLEKLEEFPCPRYLIETNADLELHTRIDSPGVRHLWTQQQFHYDDLTQSYDLNADVPEFQPVIVRQRQYPCIYDTSYEADLFPYIHGAGPPLFQLQQQIPSPSIYSEVDQPVQNIPVFLRPPESYFNMEPCWRRHHGAVLSNLVPLTGSAEQFPIGSPDPQVEPCTLVATLSAESPRDFNSNKIPNTEKMLAFLDKWLTKIYNPRSSDFSAMSSTSCRIDKIFENVQDNYRMTQEAPVVSPPMNSQRPLYSDVLMSDASAGLAVQRNNVLTCNVSSSEKFEQLEKEALEQYSGSDTILLDQPPPSSPQEMELIEKDQCQTSEKTKPCSPIFYHQGLKQQLKYDRSPRSSKPYSSPSPGSKRSSNEDAFQISCSPNKQAMWMKKKKKKPQKKKKITKQQKKNTTFEHNKKMTESEVVLINKFEKLISLFFKSFFEQEWKLVQTLLTQEVKTKFDDCLKMIKELSEWLKILIITNELKEDYRANKKRLEIADSVVVTFHSLVSILHQYVYYFSKIKSTIPFDYRLYFDSDTLKVQVPIITCRHQGMVGRPSVLSDEEFFKINSLFHTKLNVKYDPKLLNCSVLQRILGFNNKHEWKLTLQHDTSVIRKYFCLHFQEKQKKDNCRLVLDREKEQTTSTSRKLIKVVDDVPPWNGLQWKFVDGWKFDRDKNHSLVWLNKFNADSLENVAYSAFFFIIYDWLFDQVNAAMFEGDLPKYEFFWDIRKPNLISCKMLFMKTLLGREEGWCFGDVRVNKQPCLPWLMNCSNSCCISWILNHGSNTTRNRHSRKVSGQRTAAHRQKREEVKADGNKVKSRISVPDKLPPDKQLILNKIASGEIILPPEQQELGQHSMCSLQ